MCNGIDPELLAEIKVKAQVEVEKNS